MLFSSLFCLLDRPRGSVYTVINFDDMYIAFVLGVCLLVS